METTPLYMKYKHHQNHVPPRSPAFRRNFLALVHLNETWYCFFNMDRNGILILKLAYYGLTYVNEKFSFNYFPTKL